MSSWTTESSLSVVRWPPAIVFTRPSSASSCSVSVATSSSAASAASCWTASTWSRSARTSSLVALSSLALSASTTPTIPAARASTTPAPSA